MSLFLNIFCFDSQEFPQSYDLPLGGTSSITNILIQIILLLRNKTLPWLPVMPDIFDPILGVS